MVYNPFDPNSQNSLLMAGGGNDGFAAANKTLDPTQPTYAGGVSSTMSAGDTSGRSDGGSGGKNQGSGASYDPTELGRTLGSRLSGYVNNPAPVFGENLYAGMDPMERQGLQVQGDQITHGAQSGILDNSLNSINGLLTSGGMTDTMRGNQQSANNLAEHYANLFYGAAAPSLTEQRLGSQTYGMDAPGYQAMRDKLQNDVMTGVGTGFNANGRFGGGSYVDQATNSLTSALGGLDYQNYTRGQDLMRQDTNAMQQAQQARFGESMGALGGAQGAVGQSFDMGQTGLGNVLSAGDRAGSRFQDLLLPGQATAGIGSRLGEDSQNQRTGTYDLWNRGVNADYDRFRQLLGDFSGSQGNAGMTEQTPFWQQLLGYGVQAAGSLL